MIISILSIGDEILAGDTTNTNSTWISRELTKLGGKVDRQITCQDETKEIISSLSYLKNFNPNYIIITGGLGPTDDDITRKTLFDYFKVDEKFDKEYWDELVSRFKKLNIQIVESNKSQAIIPSIGEVLPNLIGSARGYCFLQEGTSFFSLPGVPKEMKEMMKHSILPRVEKNISNPIFRKLIRTTGVPESTLAEKIIKITESNHDCKIGYYPSVHGVDIRLSGTSMNKVEKLFIALQNIFGDISYADRKISIEEVIVKHLILKKKTISVAESCTGGLIMHRITNTSNSSKILNGGVITYSNESKTQFLGIPSNLILDKGAVSKQVAGEMSSRVMSKFGTDYGISVTGIAGPGGGTIEKPVGTVFISISSEHSTKVKKFMFGNDRERNKIRASQAALNMLRLSI